MTTPSEQADQLLRQGRVAEAEQAFVAILENDPEALQALNVLGLGALRDGQIERALALLQRAVTAQPQDAMSRFHLGRVRAAAGASALCLEAYRDAVRLRPDFHVARLHLADTLRNAGDPLATLQFSRALQDAQRSGRWLDASSTPASLRPLVELAVKAVRDGRRAACAALLEPLVAEFGASELTRFSQCISIYLQERAPVYPDVRQRPTFLFFPGLPAMPYYAAATFDWLPALEAQTAAIRAELEPLLPATHTGERVFNDDALERANLRGTRGAPSWTGYYFYRHGLRRDDAASACQRTAAALEALPLDHVREHGPEVLFSVFTPGTHLLPHRGVTNTRLVAHLPLIVPPDCALRVGGEEHVWREGRVVVFDDTYEHEAWNRSDAVRVVLIFDIWNPHLTAVEQLAVTRLVESIGDSRHATDAA